MKNTHKKSESEILRQKAEELLELKPSGLGSPISETDTLKLIHELEVHQIELKMQNDELRHAWAKSEISTVKYTELYDFAPSGYFTLSREGKIIELNLHASQILGKIRTRLKNSQFGFFVSDATKPIFNLFLEQVFASKTNVTCEITLLKDGCLPMIGHLTGIVSENGDQCLISLVDITERKQAEQELIMANKELAFQHDSLKKIASRVPGLVYQYLLRPDGTSCFPYASEAIREIFRVSPDEVREDSSKVFANGHPDDLPGVFASIQESAQNLTPWQHEFRVKFDDGTIRSLYGNAVPQKEVDESVLWHGFITDITEENRLKEELKSSEEQRISVLNNITDVVWSLSWPDLKVNFISQSVEQVFGRSVQEFTENPSLWADIVHADDKPVSVKAFEQLTKEGSAVRECRIVQPDGSIVWVNDKSKIIVDQNGMPIRIDGVSRDITERKRVEEELRINEERYRLLAENARDVIWNMKLDGTITYISPAIEQLRGLTVEEAMNQPLDKIHTPDSQVMVVGYLQKLNIAFASGLPLENFREELEYYCKDGSILWAEVIVFPIPASNYSSVTLIGVSRDITERKQAEEAIKLKNEQLIHANAEKDKFFSIISHDLRGPFNGFLGLSNLMAEESSDLTQDEIQKMAGAMRDSAVNLFRLLENLLEWSRLQRGITSFEPGPFLLMPMIAESMHPVIDLADKKGVEIRYEIQADLEVFADQYMLSSTIRNLASNAVKFTLKGGKVTIAAKSVPGHSVEISVSDTGIGMNPEMVHDLFRLDVQTNRRGTENEPSSGLGLLLCKDFVEMNGGRIWVESEVDKGSTFSFTLPTKAQE